MEGSILIEQVVQQHMEMVAIYACISYPALAEFSVDTKIK